VNASDGSAGAKSFWQGGLVYDPLPVGGVAVALILGTTALLNLQLDAPLLGAAFCGTALVYLADRAFGGAPEDRYNQPGRVAWVRRHRRWLMVEGIGLTTGLAALVPLLKIETILAAAGLGVVGLLHILSGPVLGRGGSSFVESLVVAVVWASGAVLLPVLEAGAAVATRAVVALTAYRTSLILPNILLVDWADREGDAAAGRGSWAMGRSRRAIQIGGTGVLSLAIGGAMTVVGWGAGPILLLVDALGGVLMAGGIWMLRPERSAAHRLALDLAVAWPVVPWLLTVVSGG